MFMLNTAGAVCNAFPDVCITPVPSPAGPVPTPLPYPNIATTEMADPGTIVDKVLVSGMPALNQMSKITTSEGDQAGTQGGVACGKIMGEVGFLIGSTKVMVGGKPAVSLGAQTSQNVGPPMNAVGACISPSQTKVMVMS